MIHLQVNPGSGIPIYRQVVDQIRQYVDSELLSAGTELPSVGNMATSLGVNPAAVARAYTELEQEDIVEMNVQKWGQVNFLISRIVHFFSNGE
ncbi:MAG: GntR family transcriptional regulator [Phycisphaerales bacterium]|jgi:GntR family transcriptional regulator|nr:GntR family transcriptional regulator [Phycisphaerales bacterium]